MVKCTSTAPVEEKGNIATTGLTFHLKTTTGEKQTPAVLITPNAATGQLAHFECAGVKVTWEGTIVGEIETPGYNEALNHFGVVFAENGGAQTPEEANEEPGVKHHLISVVGGEPEPMLLVGTIVGTFTEGEPELKKTP